jgi:hypothetical protein
MVYALACGELGFLCHFAVGPEVCGQTEVADGNLFVCFCDNYLLDSGIANLTGPQTEDRFDIVAGSSVRRNYDHSIFPLDHQQR